MRPHIGLAYAAGLATGFGAAQPAVRADEAQRPLAAQTVQAAHSSECVCRAQGRTFAVGESACLQTATGPRVADCGMVLNNTSWQFTDKYCPES